MKLGPPQSLIQAYVGHDQHPWMRHLAEQAIKSQNEALCFCFPTMPKTPMTTMSSTNTSQNVSALTIPTMGSPRRKYGD